MNTLDIFEFSETSRNRLDIHPPGMTYTIETLRYFLMNYLSTKHADDMTSAAELIFDDIIMASDYRCYSEETLARFRRSLRGGTQSLNHLCAILVLSPNSYGEKLKQLT